MKTLSYVSGKIETKNQQCFTGNQKVECPKTDSVITTSGDKLNLLPQIPSLERRSDLLFFGLLFVVIFTLTAVTILKVKIFGKTLGKYLAPIWYFILISIAVVVWQYLFGLQIENNSIPLRISQLIWEICIAASVYKLIKKSNFGYGNLFFLGILYSLIIHGLKITIRYLFYGKTFLYLIDRFLYGSLLVMAIAFVLGSTFLFLRNKSVNK